LHPAEATVQRIPIATNIPPTITRCSLLIGFPPKK
jgi:hypothetical protein